MGTRTRILPLRAAAAFCFASLCAAHGAHAQSYPVKDGFQWLTAGSSLPLGDWAYPSITDDGTYVVAASLAFPQNVLRFKRTAPSLTIAYVATNCGDPTCYAYAPRVSGDGRYIVFVSPSSYGSADSRFDVFRWDGITEATRRVSVPIGGGALTHDAFGVDVSRDGRYVSFLSGATNLAAGATFGGTKMFVADMATNPPTILHASGPYNTVESARISANGRIVVFRADNQLLVRDTQAAGPVFLGWLGAASAMSPSEPSLSLSPDGRYASQAIFSGGVYGTYVFDRLSSAVRSAPEASDSEGSTAASSGAGFVALTRCNFTNAYSAQAAVQTRAGNLAFLGIGEGPFESCDLGIDITPKGDKIAVSLPRLVAPALNVPNAQHIFVVDNPLYQPLPANVAQYQGGIPANSTNVQSAASGRLVVFQSEIPAEQLLCYDAELQTYAPGCVPADTNGQPDVFRYDRDSNAVTLVSSVDGVTAVGGRNPAIDTSAERIAFEAVDTGFVASAPGAAKASGAYGVFLADLLRNQSQRVMRRVSNGRNDAPPNGSSQHPAISGDGRIVVFSTDATNINPGSDGNGVRDVVAVDVDTNTTHCVSSCPGAIADAPSDFPSVSNTGLVAFQTRAGTLLGKSGGKAGVYEQIALRNLLRQQTQLISRTPNGQPGIGDSKNPRISNAGTLIAYQSGASNLTGGDVNGRIDVILANLLTNTNQRISRRPPGGKANPYAPKTTAAPEDGDSTQPVLSGDGRFVAFQTTATNLVDADGNGVADLIVADLRSGDLYRVAQGFGGVETDGASETPHLNHNGTSLGFHSFATNLDEVGDTNPATSEPYVRDNPAARSVVFSDAFE